MEGNVIWSADEASRNGNAVSLSATKIKLRNPFFKGTSPKRYIQQDPGNSGSPRKRQRIENQLGESTETADEEEALSQSSTRSSGLKLKISRKGTKTPVDSSSTVFYDATEHLANGNSPDISDLNRRSPAHESIQVKSNSTPSIRLVVKNPEHNSKEKKNLEESEDDEFSDSIGEDELDEIYSQGHQRMQIRASQHSSPIKAPPQTDKQHTNASSDEFSDDDIGELDVILTQAERKREARKSQQNSPVKGPPPATSATAAITATAPPANGIDNSSSDIFSDDDELLSCLLDCAEKKKEERLTISRANSSLLSSLPATVSNQATSADAEKTPIPDDETGENQTADTQSNEKSVCVPALSSSSIQKTATEAPDSTSCLNSDATVHDDVEPTVSTVNEKGRTSSVSTNFESNSASEMALFDTDPASVSDSLLSQAQDKVKGWLTELNKVILGLPINHVGLEEINLNLLLKVPTLDFESLKALATQVRAQIKQFKSFNLQIQTSSEKTQRKSISPASIPQNNGNSAQLSSAASVAPATKQRAANNGNQSSTVNSTTNNVSAPPQFGVSEFGSHSQNQQPQPISNANGFSAASNPPQLHFVPNPSPVLRPPQINGAPISDRLNLLAGMTNPQLTVPPQVLLHPPQYRMTRNQEQVLQQQLNQQMQRIQKGLPQLPHPFPQLTIGPRFQGQPLSQGSMTSIPLTPQQIQQQHRGQFQVQFQQQLQQQMQNQQVQHPYQLRHSYPQQQYPPQPYPQQDRMQQSSSPNLALPVRPHQASTLYNQPKGPKNNAMKPAKFPHPSNSKTKANPKKNARIKKSKLDKYEFPLPSEGFLSSFLNGAQLNNSNDPEDDDLVEQAMLISLLDPLSGRRLETPLRSRYCSHIECFDLWSFIEINRLRPFRIGVKRDPPTASGEPNVLAILKDTKRMPISCKNHNQRTVAYQYKVALKMNKEKRKKNNELDYFCCPVCKLEFSIKIPGDVYVVGELKDILNRLKEEPDSEEIEKIEIHDDGKWSFHREAQVKTEEKEDHEIIDIDLLSEDEETPASTAPPANPDNGPVPPSSAGDAGGITLASINASTDELDEIDQVCDQLDNEINELIETGNHPDICGFATGRVNPAHPPPGYPVFVPMDDDNDDRGSSSGQPVFFTGNGDADDPFVLD
ncbi:unnamed protein product [Ambrosiozyma monospora]|uniref:Unnamed protein product n=1 Tax=Ambrosiozyma monospora TaxID=43982 RepID=A0A9W6YR37_AMBMO|nr:unnamed protein product [Ambrosiozyma monospora]